MGTTRHEVHDFRRVRWLPRHGEPMRVIEFISQYSIKALAYLPIYTAIIVTFILLVVVFGVPFVGGR